MARFLAELSSPWWFTWSSVWVQETNRGARRLAQRLSNSCDLVSYGGWLIGALDNQGFLASEEGREWRSSLS